jgi:hypothetical protein
MEDYVNNNLGSGIQEKIEGSALRHQKERLARYNIEYLFTRFTIIFAPFIFSHPSGSLAGVRAREKSNGY